jgi:hypothetical protein
MTTDEPSDLAGLVAFRAADQWLDTGADTVTHRPNIAGCSCGRQQSPLVDGWLSVSVAQPPEPVDEAASVRFLVVAVSRYGQFVNWGAFARDTIDGPRRWYTGMAGAVVTHWMPEPALPGDEAGPLTLEYCLAQAAHWIQEAARIGTAAVATATPAEIETAEYWRARAETLAGEVKAAVERGMGLEDKQIV